VTVCFGLIAKFLSKTQTNQTRYYNAMVEQLQQLQKLNAALTKEISEERLNHQNILESLDEEKRRLYNYNLKKLTKGD